MIEANVQVVKEIGIKISNDDVDSFLEDLKDLFTAKQPEMNQEPHLSQAKNIFGTLYKLWIELKANQ